MPISSTFHRVTGITPAFKNDAIANSTANVVNNCFEEFKKQYPQFSFLELYIFGSAIRHTKGDIDFLIPSFPQGSEELFEHFMAAKLSEQEVSSFIQHQGYIKERYMFSADKTTQRKKIDFCLFPNTIEQFINELDVTLSKLIYSFSESKIVTDTLESKKDFQNKIIKLIHPDVLNRSPRIACRLMEFLSEGYALEPILLNRVIALRKEVLYCQIDSVFSGLKKLLESEYAISSFHHLKTLGLLEKIFPRLSGYSEEGKNVVIGLMQNAIENPSEELKNEDPDDCVIYLWFLSHYADIKKLYPHYCTKPGELSQHMFYLAERSDYGRAFFAARKKESFMEKTQRFCERIMRLELSTTNIIGLPLEPLKSEIEIPSAEKNEEQNTTEEKLPPGYQDDIKSIVDRAEELINEGCSKEALDLLDQFVGNNLEESAKICSIKLDILDKQTSISFNKNEASLALILSDIKRALEIYNKFIGEFEKKNKERIKLIKKGKKKEPLLEAIMARSTVFEERKQVCSKAIRTIQISNKKAQTEKDIADIIEVCDTLSLEEALTYITSKEKPEFDSSEKWKDHKKGILQQLIPEDVPVDANYEKLDDIMTCISKLKVLLSAKEKNKLDLLVPRIYKRQQQLRQQEAKKAESANLLKKYKNKEFNEVIERLSQIQLLSLDDHVLWILVINAIGPKKLTETLVKYAQRSLDALQRLYGSQNNQKAADLEENSEFSQENIIESMKKVSAEINVFQEKQTEIKKLLDSLFGEKSTNVGRWFNKRRRLGELSALIDSCDNEEQLAVLRGNRIGILVNDKPLLPESILVQDLAILEADLAYLKWLPWLTEEQKVRINELEKHELFQKRHIFKQLNDFNQGKVLQPPNKGALLGFYITLKETLCSYSFRLNLYRNAFIDPSHIQLLIDDYVMFAKEWHSRPDDAKWADIAIDTAIWLVQKSFFPFCKNYYERDEFDKKIFQRLLNTTYAINKEFSPKIVDSETMQAKHHRFLYFCHKRK